MAVTIYHNPRCSKSRETLELLEARGLEPRVVKYLETRPDAATLESLLAKLGLSARDLLRTNEAAYKELGLADTSLSDADVVKAMTAHPELIQRPIVVANGKARLGRPPERVLDILD